MVYCLHEKENSSKNILDYCRDLNDFFYAHLYGRADALNWRNTMEKAPEKPTLLENLEAARKTTLELLQQLRELGLPSIGKSKAP